MPRAKRKISTTYPYHIDARCINREWFKIPIEEVWAIFCDYIYLVKYAFNLDIYSFVLMNNHFHMIVGTPEGNLSEAMNYFMREVSREITRTAGRINQTFGAPYHASLISTSHYFLHAYKYVYRNPVDAGICQKVEDYKYSTLNGKIGNSKLFIPIINDETLISDFEGTLSWLNEEYKEGSRDKVKKALKKSTFKFSVDASTHLKDKLETILS